MSTETFAVGNWAERAPSIGRHGGDQLRGGDVIEPNLMAFEYLQSLPALRKDRHEDDKSSDCLRNQ
jgi:hypothetical protein